MSTLISQLPEEIRKKAEKYRHWSRNTSHNNLYDAFEWNHTSEGFYVWHQVNKGNYEPFHEFHAKDNIRQQLEAIYDKRLSRNETIDLLVKLWEDKL